MKKIYKNHQSSILGKEANVVALLMYVPAYLVLFASWYVSVPKLISWVVSLLPLIFMFKDESPLVRYHAASSVVINFGLMLFLNLFYLMLLGFQVHNSDWGILIYAYVNYFVMLFVYVLPAYCMVNAYRYSTTNIPLHNKAVDKISGYEKVERRLVKEKYNGKRKKR